MGSFEAKKKRSRKSHAWAPLKRHVFINCHCLLQEYVWLNHCTFILFLNKVDIFQEKIQTSSIGAHFPEYKGAYCIGTLGLVQVVHTCVGRKVSVFATS
jgi:hypothetical protein